MRLTRLTRAVIAAAILVGAVVPASIGSANAKRTSDKSGWKGFASERAKLYETLAPAFVSCFKRRDSLIDPLSPIFHGCLDWHSAVHAAYSHHVLYRRTDKKKYLALAQDQIAPAGVSLIPAEMAYEQAKGADLPLTENPYGFGWFLILVRERELSTKEKDFRAMADYAAEQMVAWFEERLSSGDAQTYILDTAHPNYSWSLTNLDVWARYTKDKGLLKAVQKFSKPLFEPVLDDLCPAERDTVPNAGGFQPACLMRLATAAQIWGGKVEKWVKARLPKDLNIPPVTDPSSCHAGGLNFTRAFSLYQFYLLTGDKSYRDNYAKLIRYHVGRPDLYIDESYAGDPGYMCYSHWVAQVGVRAISQSYEKPVKAPKAALPVK
jgi:hypothetical protein